MNKKLKWIPIPGKVFNNYTIIDDDIQLTKDKKVMYHVKCNCGKEHYVRAYFLEKGRQKSCKSCASKINYNNTKNSNKKNNFIKIKHEGIGNFTKTTYWYIKNCAKRRNIEWNEELTIEYLWNLLQKQSSKCKLSGLPIELTESRKNNNINFEEMTASLDRIDSTKGYEINNVQWVHKDVNKMKNKFKEDYFFSLCEKIVKQKNQIII